jgi:hypothetical protein
MLHFAYEVFVDAAILILLLSGSTILWALCFAWAMPETFRRTFWRLILKWSPPKPCNVVATATPTMSAVPEQKAPQGVPAAFDCR